ncbi:hypothetical protein DCC81_01975 [Chitinophaga parva]|uniref:Uncharacterized protein n=1 Tax=Chitinophaga parva TaxID=2169414 RepID=A0A2T7BKS2_9BACT|nr:hypothetical protein [Chitinophaga parva]PUZ28276.1 hypothetical protein DCC81_01975 [Chitinophaga parva]
MKTMMIAGLALALMNSVPAMAQHKKIAMSAQPSVSLATDPGDLVTTIEFQVKAEGEEVKVFSKGIIPWVNLQKADNDLKKMLNGAEIVLPYGKVTVMTTLPQSTSFVIKSAGEGGFSRSALIRALSDKMTRLPMARPETPLNLSTADVYETESGQILLKLDVAS